MQISDHRAQEDNALPEIKTKKELEARQLISVNKIFWSVSRQKVICRLTSKPRNSTQLKLNETNKVWENLFKKSTNTLKQEVAPTENYVRLDFLKSYAGEILADFLTKLILDEIKESRN
jgi:hypothetical protein